MSTRLEVRISEEDKELIERAARSNHETTAAFVRRSAREAAREVLRDEVTLVPPEFYEAMVASLSEPVEPNKALASAAKRSREVLKR